MSDFAHWSCPLCDFEDSGEYVVDPDIARRMTAHKQGHLERCDGAEDVLEKWRKESALSVPQEPISHG